MLSLLLNNLGFLIVVSAIGIILWEKFGSHSPFSGALLPGRHSQGTSFAPHESSFPTDDNSGEYIAPPSVIDEHAVSLTDSFMSNDAAFSNDSHMTWDDQRDDY
jgi:hypothetical protein